jgi:glycosyltransferase involved in cell wall biosynthesis
MQEMSFSVLSSVYRKEQPEYLEEALNSIFNQTVKSDDIVLIEDGQLTKDLENVVQKFERTHPELHVVRFEQNRGLGHALNDGLKYCRHDLVARADTDDINHANRFARQLAFMAGHPEIDAVSAWVDEFTTSPSDVISTRKLPEKSSDIFVYGKRRCPINHPVVMYRKKAVEAVGGYQTDLFPEDYFLWMKMLKAGSKFYNIQESLLSFRYNPDTVKRRGGWKYAIDEAKTQWKAYHSLHYLSLADFLFNTSLRFTIRILPNSLRKGFYTIMRKLT